MADHRIVFGDALEVLRGMDAESADCCFTSPPYYGLRAYSEDPRELGREATPDCGATGMVRLRQDLTPDQQEYVARELLAWASRDGVGGGSQCKE